MVVSRKPFTPAARFIAGLLALICLVGGGTGLLLAVTRRQLLLGVAACGIGGLGLSYAVAAWRGRPWR